MSLSAKEVEEVKYASMRESRLMKHEERQDKGIMSLKDEE